MSKAEFLKDLREFLSCLPKAEIESRLNFYSEMIDDRIEEGIPEEQAVREIGPANVIATQAIVELSNRKREKEAAKIKHSRKGWEIALIAIGSPIWLSLLISFAAVVFSVTLALFVSLWAVEISFAAGALAGVCALVLLLIQGNFAGAFLLFGAGLVCAGLSVLLLKVCKVASIGLLDFTKMFASKLKSMFTVKEK